MSDTGDLIAVGLLSQPNGLGLTADEAHRIGEQIAARLPAGTGLRAMVEWPTVATGGVALKQAEAAAPSGLRERLIAWAEAYHKKVHVPAPLALPADIRDCRQCMSDVVLVRALAAAHPEPAPEGLPELRALSEAASSGPWSLGQSDDGTGRKPQVWPRGGAPIVSTDGRPSGRIGAPEKDAADCAFIVAAVNYVRSLLTGSGGAPE